MPTSAPGNEVTAAARRARQGGFTLLELLIVVAIIAIATAGVSFAVRDSAGTQLEREAARLAALLESARAQSRTSGVAVRWVPTDGGFRFDGLPPKALPGEWLNATTAVAQPTVLLLGPEPVIGPQAVVLVSSAAPERSVRVATDGLRPFAPAAGP
jgi:general secretion pathway protein H